MSNLPATTTQTTVPQLEASLLRLLADSLTGEPWKLPEVPPETTKLRTAKIELERCLVGAGPKHMRDCVSKLAVLPTKDGNILNFALYADNFIDACGDIPPDLWTAGCIELLKVKTFRPSPAELNAVVQKQLNRRQDMLFRVKQMLTFTPALKAGFVKEPLEVRLATIRDTHKRLGNLARASAAEIELALLEGRQPQEWAIPKPAPTYQPEDGGAPMVVDAELDGLRKIGDAVSGIQDKMVASYKHEGAAREDEADYPMRHMSPEMKARTMMAVAKTHRKDGRIGYARTLEAAAAKLWPAIAGFDDSARDQGARHG